MAKYPHGLTEEENARLAHPYLPIDQYDAVYCIGGSTIYVTRSKDPNNKIDVKRMVEINKQIALRG